jgi:hypothetical protein
VQTTEAPEETTELVIPCENLALTSGGEIVLDEAGANWLINVLALPENTTDELTYASSDENVATVNAEGKITAVGEGTAVITITCGEQELKCTVTVSYPVETTVEMGICIDRENNTIIPIQNYVIDDEGVAQYSDGEYDISQIFNENDGLTVDGEVGKNTWKSLFSEV